MVAVRETLDRGDLAPLGLQSEIAAGVHRLAVEEHHAGPALGVVAPFLRTREADDVANGISRLVCGSSSTSYAVRYVHGERRPSYGRSRGGTPALAGTGTC